MIKITFKLFALTWQVVLAINFSQKLTKDKAEDYCYSYNFEEIEITSCPG